jgi:hypothetical protein
MTAEQIADPVDDVMRPTRVRRALIGAGTLIMVYGVGGALFDGDVNKVGVPAFLVALIVLHDGVFLPLVAGIGVLVGRLVPTGWRATVQVAGVVSLAVGVVALPLVLGFGRDPANPSALPGAYRTGLIVILVVVWGVPLARKGFERLRRRRAR